MPTELEVIFGNLHETVPDHWTGIILVCVSALCGMLIGWERATAHKAAGKRTLTLIAVGSTIFTLTSILVSREVGDPGRIAAQVVSGVGFLGAGAIIRQEGSIIGLTTAATIWCVAAIGVLVGAGYAVAGLVLTLLVVTILAATRWLDFARDDDDNDDISDNPVSPPA